MFIEYKMRTRLVSVIIIFFKQNTESRAYMLMPHICRKFFSSLQIFESTWIFLKHLKFFLKYLNFFKT